MDANEQFVCQECRQPIFIDSSLTDLASDPLPPHFFADNRRELPPLTTKELLDKVPAPKDVKEIWEKSNAFYQQQRRKLPDQSFVLLQDSVIKDLPTQSPSHKKRLSKTSTGTPPNNAASRKPSTPTSTKRPPADPVTPPPAFETITSQAKLFELLSSKSDIDHPLCEDCAQVLLVSLTRKLEETKRERDGYLAFEREIRKDLERERSAGKTEKELDEEITALELREAEAIKELREAESERVKLEKELEALDAEERKLQQEEEDFITTYNNSLLQSLQLESQIVSLQTSLQHSAELLAKLEKTNVYADAFCIGMEGPFGTINGLRFGRSGATGSGSGVSVATAAGPVEWAEVNAAWGLVVLCLKTIARKVECKFESYTLNALCSTSSITYHPTSKAKGEIYALHFSSDVHLGRLLHNRRFDTGMVMFLDCLRSVMVQVQSVDPSIEFPYWVQKEKIGDVSIKLQFSQEEVWTRALRHVLLTLKILLRWMTSGG